jgi:hypothetical protein
MLGEQVLYHNLPTDFISSPYSGYRLYASVTINLGADFLLWVKKQPEDWAMIQCSNQPHRRAEKKT